MVTPEGSIKAGCIHFLRQMGFYVWNNPTGAVQLAPNRWLHFGKKGSSDIIGILPGGRFFAVEVKAPGGRLSPEQKQFLDDISRLGGLAVMVQDWRELAQILREAGYINNGPLFADSTLSV